MNNITKIVGIIAIYKPQSGELKNIEKYLSDLDYCYLMDDSGEDNSKLFTAMLEKYAGKLEYVMNERNIGLCASVNRGFKRAEALGAGWALVMNPDGTFDDGAIRIFRNYIQSIDASNVAIICPTYNIDRRPRTAGNGSKEITYADMTGCLYNTDILNKLGYYDQNTYFYGLDTEYCMRVIKNGYKIIECSEAVLNHMPAETRHLKLFGKTIFSYGFDKPIRFYYQFRSSEYIHKKYGLNKNDLFMVYKLLKVLLFFENKNEYFKMIKLGKRDAKIGFYGNYFETHRGDASCQK